MKTLLYVFFLTLVACGGGEGEGGKDIKKPPVVGNDPNIDYQYGQGSGYETLAKFQDAVNKNQWGQHQYWNQFRNVRFVFKYVDPKASEKCTGSSFKLCFNFSLSAPPTIHTTKELSGKVSGPLVPTSTIKNVVKRANNNNAYFSNGNWIIQIDSKTFIFNLSYPLGGNPIYYKNSSGKEYSLSTYGFEQ